MHVCKINALLIVLFLSLFVCNGCYWNWCVGRHRCSQCDYSVDRQHILDYHVKIVHVAGTAEPASVTERRMMTVDLNEEEATVADTEQLQEDCTPPPVKRRGVCRGDSGQLMTTTAYRCISCGYSGHSVASMARHRLRHSTWSLPYRCWQCSHRATTGRLLVRHASRRHERQSTDAQGDVQIQSSTYKSSDVAGRRYTCRHCPYFTDQPSLLVQHRRVHHSQPTLRCADCPFTCRDRDQLRSHRGQHSVVGRCRPHHGCDHCSFTARSRNALLHHRRLHDQRH